MVNLYDLHTINENITFAIGSVLYAILFFCIFTTKVDKLTQYRRILLQPVLLNFFLLVTNFLTKPIKIIEYGYEYFIMNGILHNLPQPWRFIAFDTWIFAIGLSILNTPIGFIYQYMVIVHNKQVNFRRQLFYFFTVLSLVVFYCLSYYYIFYYQNYEYFGLANSLPISDENGVVWIAGLSRPYYKQPAVYINMGMILVLVPAAYIVIVYCNFRTYWYIRKHKTNIQMDSVQRQLIRVAIYTTIVPFTSQALPCLFVPYALINTKISMMPYSVFITVALAWVAPCNAFVFLFLIKPYRDRCYRFVRRFVKLKNTKKVSVNGPPTNTIG